MAIVYKTIPDESHMALVMYTDSLPQLIHDESMKVLESAVGQQAKELADALFRHVMADGRKCLETIHKGGYLKKVPTNQVIVIPNSKSTCRLDELNDILAKMADGAEASKKLADMDANRGTKGVLQESRTVGEPAKSKASARTSASDISEEVLANDSSYAPLTTTDLFNDRMAQAKALRSSAKGQLTEAVRLEEEAKLFAPKVANVKKTRKPRTTKKVVA